MSYKKPGPWRNPGPRVPPSAVRISPGAVAGVVAALTGMTYAIVEKAKREEEATDREELDRRLSARERQRTASASSSRGSGWFGLGGSSTPSAENVPKFVLANSGLDDEQKLQVALARRQCWVRAAQFGPTLALWSYAGCVLAERVVQLPRGSRAAVPLAACLVGMTAGSYYGGLEGKPMMIDALLARPIQGVHQRRGEGGRPMANGEPGAHTQ